MSTLNKLTIAFFLLIIMSGCNRSIWGNHPDRLVLPGKLDVLYPCIIGKDTEILDCGEITLERIKDIDESEDQVNPIISFEKQFNAVFYNDFFEILLVEPDLRQAFAKKVVVTDVKLLQDNVEPLMKECSACNAVATVYFNDELYYYPYTAPKSVRDVVEDAYKLVGKTENLMFTIYQNKNGENIKVTFTSNKNKARSFKLTKGSKQELLDLMRAFKFPKKDRNKVDL